MGSVSRHGTPSFGSPASTNTTAHSGLWATPSRASPEIRAGGLGEDRGRVAGRAEIHRTGVQRLQPVLLAEDHERSVLLVADADRRGGARPERLQEGRRRDSLDVTSVSTTGSAFKLHAVESRIDAQEAA